MGEWNNPNKQQNVTLNSSSQPTFARTCGLGWAPNFLPIDETCPADERKKPTGRKRLLEMGEKPS